MENSAKTTYQLLKPGNTIILGRMFAQLRIQLVKSISYLGMIQRFDTLVLAQVHLKWNQKMWKTVLWLYK